jgi:hypothetical protein
MFIQVIHGRVADAEELHDSLDQWMRELRPGAEGWLGSTGGVTDDGRCILVARFDSAEAARRNSDRPEQHQWWMETSKLFGGGATFHDCHQVDVWGRAGSDHAGFVQIVQSQVRDPAALRELMMSNEDVLTEFRPEVIGGTVALHDDEQATTMTVYFNSEEAARAGERKEPTPQIQELMTKQMEYIVGEPTYFDLRNPWLHSPS